MIHSYKVQKYAKLNYMLGRYIHKSKIIFRKVRTLIAIKNRVVIYLYLRGERVLC